MPNELHVRDLPAGATFDTSGRVVTLARDSATQRGRRAAGQSGEDAIEKLLADMRARGVAWITKRPTPLRVVGRAGPMLRCVPVKKAGVDYHGHVRGGRAVYLEAKRTTAARFYLSEIPRNQVEELDHAAITGAIALLVVVWGGRSLAPTAILWPGAPPRPIAVTHADGTTLEAALLPTESTREKSTAQIATSTPGVRNAGSEV